MKVYINSVIISAFLITQVIGDLGTSGAPSTTKEASSRTDAKITNATKKTTDPLQNRINQAATDCKKELNAQQGTSEILALVSSGALPTNEKQRCFLECVYGKIGLIKDGKLNDEGALNLAKQKFGENKDMLGKADVLFKKCKSEATITEKNSKEKCALGRLVRSCITTHGKELPIFNGKV